jgi:hypothetical protein
VLSNLANFAYDPINYEWLRQAGVADLLIGMLSNYKRSLAAWHYPLTHLCQMYY